MTNAEPSPRTKNIMGIDLGTTNSCVAIPCEGEGPDSVVVITDAYDRATVPSVVYRDASGKYLVGHNAKQKMGSTPPPIAFIKRYMGKEHHVQLRDEMLTPEQVSAIILGHLRDMVHDKLGVEITQAVITIPARFDLAGQQATVEAARIAGLDVLTTMPEPVAAALAYGLQDDADNLKIFCYDLGGGTFDATVMVKSAETGIEVLAFDGDEHLGGFNFDTEFSKWMLQRLQAKHYSLDLDWSSAPDLVIFQKLMRIAEKAKIALSEQPEHTISEKEVFEDHDGNAVDIEIEVRRDEYIRLILPLLERTIEISARAIEKAGLTPADIDRVIMVGGSSRLPVLREMLERKLQRPAQLVDPDKIVARGAAVKAGTMIGGSHVSGIEFLVPLPLTWSLDSFDVLGRVTLPGAAHAAVSIEREDGGYSARAETDEEGKFTFTEVELSEGEDNGFEIRVGDRRAPLLTHSFQVRQDPTAVTSHIDSNFITNEIGLLVSNGSVPIFKEGEHIPRDGMATIGTVSDGQTHARFDVYDGSHVLGEVVILNLPEGLPRQSTILVNVHIDGTLAISGRATLTKTGQSTDFTFRIAKPKLPSLDDMRKRFEILRDDFDDAVSHVMDDMIRTRQYGSGQRQMRELRKALDDEPCDVPRASRLIDEFALFIGNLARIDVLLPPWETFNDKLADAREQAAEAQKHFEKARRADFATTLDGLEAYATQAFRDRDKELWEQANAQLDKILGEIDTISSEAEVKKYIEGLTPEERAEQIRRELAKRLQEAQRAMSAHPRSAALEPSLRELIRTVNGLSALEPRAVFENWRKISGRIDELMEKLKPVTGDTGLMT